LEFLSRSSFVFITISVFMNRLHQKIALITGAAQGIGAATAELFAREGATVVVSDINDTAGTRIAERCGANSYYLRLDVRHEYEWQQAAAQIRERFGRLDVLVNNAGITGFPEDFSKGFALHDPEHVDLSDWRAVHEVNLDGVMLGCKYAIGLMKSHGGSIVNISSRSGIVGIPGAAAYASSKAAIRNHTKTVALYCAQHGYKIRCNSIHPAAILTPMWDAMLGTGEARAAALKAVEAGIPVGAMGEPLDVAYAALYLASDESKYVTGIELTVDGGILAGAEAAPQTAE
jgi:NAD(P)-dependent dehydrogenase (short-subunit alcohol dehydrogenase family)